jgi:hypothetical protein
MRKSGDRKPTRSGRSGSRSETPPRGGWNRAGEALAEGAMLGGDLTGGKSRVVIGVHEPRHLELAGVGRKLPGRRHRLQALLDPALRDQHHAAELGAVGRFFASAGARSRKSAIRTKSPW